jgi:small subunit ribosomal protein S3
LGQKVHPIGFRLGIINDWRSKWYAGKHYTDFLQEDLHIRKLIQAESPEAGISKLDIERWANEVIVTAHTARPGIVIGRGGQRVDELRRSLEKLCGKRVRVNIQEIREPELDAYLVAKNVANQIEHQIAFRRAIRRAVSRTMQAGAKGIKITCSGRLGGTEIARKATFREGRVPLHTIRADIDYGFCEARTLLGRIGVKVWIYKGDILPEREVLEEETPQPIAIAGEEQQEEGGIEQPIEVGGDLAAEEGEVEEGREGVAIEQPIEVGDVTAEESKVSEST